jgi:DNA polymerase/3'-5' exonuclease PolX
MELNKARNIAEKIVEELKPYCEIINIAGSIRRGKIEVKDIEIVALPKCEESGLLFGESKREPMKSFYDKAHSLGGIVKGGKRYIQLVLKEDVKLDLFIPEHYDYYRQFALRTGSADYSHKVIAVSWNKKGWVGTDEGLRKHSDCIQKGKKWVCLNAEAEKPPIWRDEKEFFDWAGIKYIEPEKRDFLLHTFDKIQNR